MRAFAQAPSAGSTSRGNGNTFSFGAFAAMLVCAAAFLGIGAPTASAAPEAAPGFAYQTTIGSSSSDGTRPNPVAVDPAGNLLFVDTRGSNPIGRFASDGSPLPSVDTVALGGNFPVDIAVDPVTGDLYVQDTYAFFSINRFVSDGQPVPTYTLDSSFQLSPGAGIAVDPVSHDLLVAAGGAEEIRRYDTTGALVETIATPSITPQYIATAADGSIYVAAQSGTAVSHLSPTGALLGTLEDVGSVKGLAVDQSDGRLIVHAGNNFKSYTEAGSLISESEDHGDDAGIAIDGSSGRLYGFTGSAVNVYVPATIPGVEAPVVSAIQPDSVHVEAEVAPGAGPPEGSVARFEYSENGGETWTPTSYQPLSGTDTIEADLEGLTLNQAYLVRVRASNALVSTASSTTSFSTPEVAPVVETGVASEVSETSAVLNGTVNPAGQLAGYHFEYGTTTAYGSRIPISSESPAGSQRVPRAFSKHISGLQPGITYHYRLVASNASGQGAGVDRTFTTLDPSEAAPERAYEQVTPAGKNGAQVLADQHSQAAADGSALVLGTAAAAQDAQSSPISQHYLSRRGPSGWQSWQQIDPPVNTAQGFIASTTAAVSEDMEHALVVSNRVLAPGGIAGGANIYVEDLQSGTYTFVAAAPGEGAYALLTLFQHYSLIYVAGAPDFSWVVFYGEVPFLPEAFAPALYRWSETDGLSIESRVEGEVVPFAPVQAPDVLELEFPQVSADGDVVGFSFAFGVYRRENGVSTPISVSHKAGDDPTVPLPGRFEGMTKDGRYMFFTSTSELTEDAPGGNQLYRYDAQTGDLQYLANVRLGPNVTVFGFAQDGETVYFDDGGKTVVWRSGQLSPVTSSTPFVPVDNTGNQSMTNSTGRYFVWRDDNEFGNIHLYDAEAGESVCITCPADGGSGGGATLRWGSRTIGNRSVRALLEDGTVFFTSPARLVSADHNGTKDVYEYKDGRLALITPGDADFDAFFVDASADGTSVFFQTDEGIVAQDLDKSSDVYVARVGGGFPSQNQPPGPAPCSGADCGPVGADQTSSAPLPGSMTGDPPERVKVSVAKVTPTRRAIKVGVQVNQAGTLKVSGSGIKTKTKGVSGPGAYTVTAPLTKKARKQLAAGKQVKVSLKVSLSGETGSASANYSRTLG